jgi:SNF2 family DNA or RNA helicase
MACEGGARALMLFYLMGSGKTIAALYTVHKLDDFWRKSDQAMNTLFPRVLVIAPAKVVTQVWEPAIKALNLPRDRFWIHSFEMARGHYQEYAGKLREIRRSKIEGSKEIHRYNTILIIDESHIVRTTSSQLFHAMFAIAAEVDKLLLLTGTPMINGVQDMESQLRLLTDDPRAMIKASYYVNPRTLDVLHAREFVKHFSGLVLTHREALGNADYPETIRDQHEVPMYALQEKRYKEFESELMTPELKALMQAGIIDSTLNSFLTRTRAISNTVGKYILPGEYDTPEKSAKFRGIRHELLNGPKPAFVYSFYLGNGVVPLKQYIDDTTDLRTALLTGKTGENELRTIMERYNDLRDIDVIFMTSSVRQGITFLNTRQGHIMESSWNEGLEDQVISRFVRYRSHHALPPKERNVHIHFWITVLSDDQISTDQYIDNVARRKMRVIAKFEEILAHLKQPPKCL